MNCWLVLCNVPDTALALTMGRILVDEKLAACVTILSPCQSLYHWQGTVELAQEVPLLIKTTNACQEKLVDRISQIHPYAIPEIIAVPIVGGLPAYLTWVHQTCDLPSEKRV